MKLNINHSSPRVMCTQSNWVGMVTLVCAVTFTGYIGQCGTSMTGKSVTIHYTAPKDLDFGIF